MVALVTALFMVSAHAEPSLRFSLPLDCTLETDCWVVNHVDLDSSEKKRDFTCRHHTYDGHKGTDFAIRDLRRMGEGVRVLASAAGVVTGIRDGMPDIDVALVGREALGGRECGNGVVVRHNDGWETQYCHLRQGSVTVRKGQTIESGTQLGLVGQSGWAEFPHVHLSVRQDGRIVDPFTTASPEVGGAGCTAGNSPVPGTVKGLWQDGAIGGASYARSAIYNAGFSGVTPNVAAIRAGLFNDETLPATAPVIAFWADMFWVEAGDRITMKVLDPDGGIFAKNTITPEKHQARQYMFVGKKLKAQRWRAGQYIGLISIERTGKKPIEEGRELTIP